MTLSKKIRKGKKMKNKSMNRLIGKYCKIVSREPGDQRAHVVFGKITDIDYELEFLILESDEGTGVINLKTIEAIKPREK
jgi:hypothetical protein